MTASRCAFIDDGDECTAAADFRLSARVVERPACVGHLGPMSDALLCEEGARLTVTRLPALEGVSWDEGLSDPTVAAVLSARRLTERERRRGR